MDAMDRTASDWEGALGGGGAPAAERRIRLGALSLAPIGPLFVVAVLCVVAAGLSFLASSASAAYAQPYLGQLTGFSFAPTVAVHALSGDVLVGDSSTGAIKVFNSLGSLVASWTGSATSNPPGTASGSFGAIE